jgi:hypothetical protein
VSGCKSRRASGRVGTLKAKPAAVITADPKELSGMTLTGWCAGARVAGEGLAGMRPRRPSGSRRGRNGRSNGTVPARKAGYGLPGLNPATRMRTGSFSPSLRLRLRRRRSRCGRDAAALTSYALLSVPGESRGSDSRRTVGCRECGRCRETAAPDPARGTEDSRKIKLLSAFALLAVLSLSSLGCPPPSWPA